MNQARCVIMAICLLFAAQLMAAKEAESNEPIALEELDTRIEAILEETGAPGMIGAIVFGDEVIWQGALGMANLDFEQPVTTDTLFRVGSISKSMVSLAILILVERGQLSLDELISDLAPETGVVNPWEETDPVRLVHTLEHTAGFDDIHFRDFAFSDPNVTLLQGIEFNNGSRDVRWRPGTRMAYSNIGPPIAAAALENVTGMTFENFVNQEIFGPLGMNRASFFFAEGVASSYTPGNEVSPYVHIPVRPSGALNATSGDMAQLLKMFIGRGTLGDVQLIQAETLARMETPTTTVGAEQGLRVGYGLSNYTSLRNGFIFHGHNGGIDGFSSSYAYHPESGRGFFYSVNQPNGPAIIQIRDLITDFVTQDLPAPTPPPVIELGADELAEFEGFYESDSPRIQLMAGVERLLYSRVQAEEGKLIYSPFLGEARELLPLGDRQFRGEDDPVATYIFATSPDGEDLLQMNQRTMIKIGPVKAYGRMLALLYGVLMWVSSLLFALYWAVKMIRRRQAGDAIPYLRIRALPALAALFFALQVYLISRLLGAQAPSDVAVPNLITVGLWLVSMLFPIVTAIALYTVASHFNRRQEIGVAVWHHSLHTTLGLAVFAIFMIGFGFVGLQTWAY